MDKQTKDLIVNDEILQVGYFSLKFQQFLQRLWKSPYVYSALISQAGTTNPTTKVLNNSIGTVSWVRTDVGIYELRSNQLFKENKTTPVKDAYTDISGNYLTVEWIDSSTVRLKTYASTDTSVLADSVLSDQLFTLEIFNN